MSDPAENKVARLMVGFSTEKLQELVDKAVQEIKDNNDIVQVVRCKDCRGCYYDKMADEYWCNGIMRAPDFFCANGKKK